MNNNAIRKLLTCKFENCLQYYQCPIRLECCDETICREHLDKLISNSSEKEITYTCQFCLKTLTLTQDCVFKTNKDICYLLDNPDLYLTNQQLSLKSSIDNLNRKLDDLDLMAKDPHNFIYEELSKQTSAIDLTRESIINKINQVSDEMLKRLSDYKKECEKNLEDNIDYIESFKLNKSHLKSNLEKSYNMLRQTYKTDNPSINDMILLIDNENSKQEKSLNDLKLILLNNKIARFDRNLEFNPNQLGTLKISNYNVPKVIEFGKAQIGTPYSSAPLFTNNINSNPQNIFARFN